MFVHLVHDYALMKMVAYKCGVILFMISLCWGGELNPGTESNKILDDSQKDESIVVEEQSCPTWYRAVRNSGIPRCVCDANFEHLVICDDT